MKKFKKKFYLNKAQNYLRLIAAKNLITIASRRFGKSEGVIMPILLRNLQSMPGSAGAIIANTYKQALTRTLPATFHALSRLGYIEDVHFVVGKRAPAKLQFKEPYIKPRKWDNYIHWYNGSVNPIISQDVPYSSNSMTLDYIIADEAKTLNHDKLQNETIPALSGLHYFRNNPWHKGYTYVTDMPANPNHWLLKEESKMDKDLLSAIETIIYQISNYKARPDINTEPVLNKIKALEKQLNFFRSKLTLYVEYSILENLEYVGVDYIDEQFRNLNPYIFKTAIMSHRAKRADGNFYGALTEKYYYTAINNDYLMSFRTSNDTIDWKAASKHKFDCKQDTDIDYSKPLCIAFDTNININWIVVGQPDYKNNKLYTINSFFVKNGKMLPEVIKNFAKYYKPLHNKTVIFYYDHTFLQGRSATHSDTFHETIKNELNNLGWYVKDIYIGQAEKHNIKHKEIDMALKGKKTLKPYFNKENNKALIIALENAGTKVTSRGWGKDKSQEKEPDSELNPVEYRTDGTDAWDTLFIGCLNFPYYNVISHVNLNTEVH